MTTPKQPADNSFDPQSKGPEKGGLSSAYPNSFPAGSTTSHGSDAEVSEALGTPLEIRFASGTDDPLSDAEIQEYRREINRLDRVIIEAIHRRSDVSKAIGKTRMGSGGTKLVYTREVAIINMFREEFGSEGVEIAKALLQLGRGRLG